MERNPRDFDSISLIDTHCHLHYETEALPELIQAALHAGLSHLITVAIDMASLKQNEAIATRYAEVFFTAGVHPHEVHHAHNQDLCLLEKAATHPKCVAIGEIGLDTYYESTHLETQKIFLEQQIHIANTYHKPPVVHIRGKPMEEVESLILSFLKHVKIPGVIHCFGGSAAFGNACLEMGFYLSFSGIITFKNAQALQSFAKTVPLSQLLVETDAPYLAPVPFRGQRCTPAMVLYTARHLAALRGEPFDLFAQATSANAKRAFNLPEVL